MDPTTLKNSDFLALERTKLANERTFLAYFRTFIVLVSSGFAILKIEGLQNIKGLGYFFTITAFTLLVIGITRYLIVNKKIHQHFN